jgi:hypothetical protein
VPCSMVKLYRRFGGASCFYVQSDEVMEGASSSETLVNFYQTTRRTSQMKVTFVLAPVKACRPVLVHVGACYSV